MNSGRHGMREPPSSLLTKSVRVSKFSGGINTGCGCVPAVCTKAASAGHVQMMLRHLTPDEFNWLIAGVDWQQVKGHDLTKWGWQNEPELRPENTQNTLLTQ